jgi:hypothetical protein
MFVEVLYLTGDEPINKNDVLVELKNIKMVLYKLAFGKDESLKSSYSSDKASGIKTRKNRGKRFLNTKTKTKTKMKTNISFKRGPKVKRFKNPIFLDVK